MVLLPRRRALGKARRGVGGPCPGGSPVVRVRLRLQREPRFPRFHHLRRLRWEVLLLTSKAVTAEKAGLPVPVVEMVATMKGKQRERRAVVGSGRGWG